MESRVRNIKGSGVYKHECSNPECNKIKEPHRMHQRYCAKCHAEYMKQWRLKQKDKKAA